MADFNVFLASLFSTVSSFLVSSPIKYLWYMLICSLVVDLLFQLLGLGSKYGRRGG